MQLSSAHGLGLMRESRLQVHTQRVLLGESFRGNLCCSRPVFSAEEFLHFQHVQHEIVEHFFHLRLGSHPLHRIVHRESGRQPHAELQDLRVPGDQQCLCPRPVLGTPLEPVALLCYIEPGMLGFQILEELLTELRALLLVEDAADELHLLLVVKLAVENTGLEAQIPNRLLVLQVRFIANTYFPFLETLGLKGFAHAIVDGGTILYLR